MCFSIVVFETNLFLAAVFRKTRGKEAWQETVGARRRKEIVKKMHKLHQSMKQSHFKLASDLFLFAMC